MITYDRLASSMYSKAILMAWLYAEKIDALPGRRHFRLCVRETHAAATFGPSLDPSV